MSRRKGTYKPDPTIAQTGERGTGAADLYVGFDGDIPIPSRTLCRSCERLPYPIPADPYWCCKSGFRPHADGSCRFYARAPGADDERVGTFARSAILH